MRNFVVVLALVVLAFLVPTVVGAQPIPLPSPTAPAVVVTGRAINPDGTAIYGAYVTLTRYDEQWKQREWISSTYSGWSQGAFTLAMWDGGNIPAGHYLLEIDDSYHQVAPLELDIVGPPVNVGAITVKRNLQSVDIIAARRGPKLYWEVRVRGFRPSPNLVVKTTFQTPLRNQSQGQVQVEQEKATADNSGKWLNTLTLPEEIPKGSRVCGAITISLVGDPFTQFAENSFFCVIAGTNLPPVKYTY